MENRYEITDEMMRNASTYITLANKDVIAQAIADVCCVPVENDAESLVPPVYKENNSVKATLLLGVMLNMYFHIGDEVGQISLTEEEADGWGAAHIINQIERYKAVPEFKTKAFDILQDYRETEKVVNGQIFGMLKDRNDPVRRFFEAVEALASKEGIEEGVKNAQALAERMNAIKQEEAND